ncbi:Gp19/Gp15/Gp42 family protein [Aeromicrobium piscarium]|uniref:Uncharacterized protein n=1 Tax=Aeromicrobium piscarium TaxID=2590901 RepID=A0A554SP82_9ACTN|nr:Gp19/Gp15/Gp42 family protein [Aeromicrobium piscarium]TSD68128.1 hypothetical protein FNM00_00590 [Aeromicrobium piscarium]
MSYTIPEDVAVELGRPASSITDDERQQWQAWIERVERKIRARFKREGHDLDDAVDTGRLSQEEITDVVVSAVARRVRNPNGITSTTVTVDDGTITRRREGVDDSLGLDLTDTEWEQLLPATEADAFSLRPTFTRDRCGGRFW